MSVGTDLKGGAVMTTIEFAQKQLKLAHINLKKAQQRSGTTQNELNALKEKIAHYETIVSLLGGE